MYGQMGMERRPKSWPEIKSTGGKIEGSSSARVGLAGSGAGVFALWRDSIDGRDSRSERAVRESSSEELRMGLSVGSSDT